MTWQQLPSHSRVWIYQADRFLSDAEARELKQMADEFVSGWSSHGSRLSADIEIFDNLFVVVFVDEQQAAASGCSIDKSMNFIRNAEIKFKMSLTDRMQVAYRVNGKTEKTILNNLSLLKKEGKINDDTLMADNLISTKEEFESRRWKKAGESWHRQFLG